LKDSPKFTVLYHRKRTLEHDSDSSGLNSTSSDEKLIITSVSQTYENKPEYYGVLIMKQSSKRRKHEKKYVDVSKIPISSNIVERFFSQVKLNLTCMRNRLLPSTLENIMFLKTNSKLWGKVTVQKAIRLVQEHPGRT
jgi:hypothetical protein